MERLKIDQYFDDDNKSFYEFSSIIKILEKALGKSLIEIKEEIKNLQIVVTKEQIEEYLENKFKEENPELKARIENRKLKTGKIGVSSKLSKSDIEEYAQEFIDYMSAQRYTLEPFALEYFNKYTTIVRNKLNKLLYIIENIGNNNIIALYDDLRSLDINIEEDGLISKVDIARLVGPTVYNLDELKKFVERANDLMTYLTFGESKESLMKAGILESEIYPSEALQVNDSWNDYHEEDVRLTENQREKLEEQERKNLVRFAKRSLQKEDLY